VQALHYPFPYASRRLLLQPQYRQMAALAYELVSDPDHRIRSAAVHLSQNLMPEDAVGPLMIAAVADPQPAIRRQAITAFIADSSLSHSSDAIWSFSGLHEVRTVLREMESEHSRLGVDEQIGLVESKIEGFRKRPSFPDPEDFVGRLRNLAADSLFWHGNEKEALEMLIRQLSSGGRGNQWPLGMLASSRIHNHEATRRALEKLKRDDPRTWQTIEDYFATMHGRASAARDAAADEPGERRSISRAQ
jgi:hypothetical protein